MGCSSSAPEPKFTVSYCTLKPISNNPNFFKIELIDEEEIIKIPGEKFLNQCGTQKEPKIIKFLDRKEFKYNTIFYYYLKKEPIIKNLFQSINFQPYNYPKLFKIVLLSTENAKPLMNLMIERKTKNLPYFQFVDEKIDFDNMKKALEEINDSNISKDNILINEEQIFETNEEIEEKNDEIIINNGTTKEELDNLINEKNREISSAKLYNMQIHDINSFVKLLSFLEEKKIKKFSFYNNSLNAEFEGWDFIYEFLEKNYSIRYIDLHDNNIDDNNLYEILRAICDKRIKYLDLNKNFISIDSCSILSEFLKNNKTLQSLNLSRNSSNKFQSNGVRIILESLEDSPSIKTINFSDMHLTECGEYISNFLSKNKSIERLILRNIELNTIDFKNIFENLKTNDVIKEIDISMNYMGGDKSLEYIAQGINENTSLNTLKIDKINLNNDNYKIIFDAIEKNQNISCYSLNYNSKLNPKIVIDFFGRQKQVTVLYYQPYDKNNKEDKNKEMSLDDKKLLDKLKNERPELKIIQK